MSVTAPQVFETNDLTKFADHVKNVDGEIRVYQFWMGGIGIGGNWSILAPLTGDAKVETLKNRIEMFKKDLKTAQTSPETPEFAKIEWINSSEIRCTAAFTSAMKSKI